MPNSYFDITILTRGQGRSAVASSAYTTGSKLTSAVAAAAYRSGEVLHDDLAGKTFDYRRKENIVHTEIMKPDNAPSWVDDRQALWNKVEAGEKRKDAQLARSFIAALPRELNTEQNTQLVRDYVQKHFVSRGMVADIAIHDKDASDGGRNPHVHILFTMREINPDGFAPKKNRDWNSKEIMQSWRDGWEETTNRHLEAAGVGERLSLKSYEEQGIDKIPGQHIGYDANGLEKKGVNTNKGNKNRGIKQDNAVREVLREDAPEMEQPEAAEPIELPQEVVSIDEDRQRQAVKSILRDSSSGSTRETIERINRMAGYIRDKAVTYGKAISDRVSSWTDRVRPKDQGRTTGDKGGDYER